MLAQWLINEAIVDEVWFVVSPQNPFKRQDGLMDAERRLQMLQEALEGNPHMKACDVELRLPTPSYTINTLRKLQEENPDKHFALLMGADNVAGLPHWREAEAIFQMVNIIVYPRDGITIEKFDSAHMQIVENAPRFDISSTQIRRWFSEGKDISPFIPKACVRIMNE